MDDALRGVCTLNTWVHSGFPRESLLRSSTVEHLRRTWFLNMKHRRVVAYFFLLTCIRGHCRLRVPQSKILIDLSFWTMMFACLDSEGGCTYTRYTRGESLACLVCRAQVDIFAYICECLTDTPHMLFTTYDCACNSGISNVQLHVGQSGSWCISFSLVLSFSVHTYVLVCLFMYIIEV